MKAIAVFSGKGGVGKSTVSALFATALARTKSVVLLDLDVNTPSQPVLFGERQVIEGARKKRGSLRIVSTGFSTKKAIMHTGSMARSLMRSLANRVVKMNPDVCIIDMPPGTGDAQLEVCRKLKPSSFLLVVQPNRLSYEDAKRAVDMFQSIGVPIAGAVQNMIGDLGELSSEVLGMPVLAHIVMRKEIARLGSAGKIDEVEDNPLNAIAGSLYEKAISIDWRGTEQEVLQGPPEYEVEFKKDEQPHYVGLQSWDAIREEINWGGYRWGKYAPVLPDQFLEECTAERIECMLKGLDETGIGMFMIVKAPATAVALFPGEIGMAHLGEPSKMHYGVPRIAYQTDEGEVILFANEVKPVSHEELMQMIEYGEHVRVGNTTRYVPTFKVMEQIEWAYGGLAHVPTSWREEYAKLGITNGGKDGQEKTMGDSEGDDGPVAQGAGGRGKGRGKSEGS